MTSAHCTLSSSSSSCECDSIISSVDEDDGHDDEQCSGVKQIGRAHCLCVCDECMVWCNEQEEQQQLFIWFALMSEPILITTLTRRPSQIVMTSIPLSIAVLDSECVSLYTVHVCEEPIVKTEQENIAKASWNDCKSTNQIECDDDKALCVCKSNGNDKTDRNSWEQLWKTDCTNTKVSVKLTERFFCKYTLPSEITHLSLTTFDSQCVVSWNCLEKMELVQLPITNTHREKQHKNKLIIDSSAIFTHEQFTLCCLDTIDELFVLSHENHLIKVVIDWNAQEMVEKYDGHVITRAHHVTAMRANVSKDASDALLAVALSNGEVILMSTLTLNKVKVIDTFYYIQHMLSCDSKEQQQQHHELGNKHAVNNTMNLFEKIQQTSESLCTAIVLDVSIGEHYITAMTPDGVIVFDKLTYEFDSTRSTLFYSKLESETEDDMQIGCSCNGSWFVYRSFNQTLEYHFPEESNHIAYKNTKNARLICEGAIDGDDGDDTLCDIVHATSALPHEWMQPLMLPPNAQEKGNKHLTHARCLQAKSRTNNDNTTEQIHQHQKSNFSLSKQTSCETTSGKSMKKIQQRFQNKQGSCHQTTLERNNDNSDASTQKRSSSMAKKNRVSCLLDKPVTFGHPIKSSSYDCQPWSVQQERKRKLQLKQKAKQRAMTDQSTHHRVNPLECRIMSPYTSHPLCLPYRLANNGSGTSAVAYIESRSTFHSSAVVSLCTSASGKCVFAAGADGSVLMCESQKIANGQVDDNARVIRQHGAPLCCVDCNLSLHTPLLMTSSVNGELMMMKPNVRETAYITHQEQSKKAIESAHFFYLDQFIAFTCGNSLQLVKYMVDDAKDDLHRARNESHLSPSPLLTYAVDAQCITSMDGINHFASNLLLMTTSSKEIHILDVCAQAPLRIIRDAHNRPIHHLVLNKNGRFVSSSCNIKSENADVCIKNDITDDKQNNNNNNNNNSTIHHTLSSTHNTSPHLFATAGLDNAVRVWDMRQSRPVRALTFHKNTALSTIGISFDQTGSLLTNGSEDRSLYVYDIRMSGNAPLDVIKCPDVPSALVWHPLQPILLVGMMSGAVMSFSQREARLEKHNNYWVPKMTTMEKSP